MKEEYKLSHLKELEAESIHIIREVAAEFENPVMLYSIGKDSSVMVRLAEKAFAPGKVPFPLMHIDSKWKFKEMIQFRDEYAKKYGWNLIVESNMEAFNAGVGPFTHGSKVHTDLMKTQALLHALDKYKFDAAFGGARRDEEKSRAKERIFSFRDKFHQWDPKNQRPELWDIYNARVHKGESIRVFPLSNWTELDIWQYIRLENIPIVPLYFAKERPCVEIDGNLIMADDDRLPEQYRDQIKMRMVRFRTLGCWPLTGAVESDADTIEITDSTVISNGHDSDNGNSGAGIGGGGFGAGGGAGGGISNITIKDADVTAGADAGGAGIGSGRASGWISYPSIFPNWKAEHPNEGVASDITISGGRVKASGGDDSAGIGGGYLGSGSDITIKDNADVTANGGKWGAGIGGGRGGDGSDISISDSNVSASGGAAGAGIGGGRGGKGENVTISGSSTVSVKHGPGATLTSGTCYGAGAGIGNGGGKDDVRGEEIAPDISGIDSTGQGYINYYDSDNNLLTRVPSAPAPEENDSEGDDAEPALSASMKQAVSQLEVRGALRQNLMQDTSIVQQDYDADAHVLTIRAELSIATLTGTLGSLKALQAQGVTTIALVTQHCTSTLDFAELTALGGEDTVFSLVHTAGIPTLSVGGALHNELIH